MIILHFDLQPQFKYMNCFIYTLHQIIESLANYIEGREGVKRELGFAFFRGWEMGFCALGLGFMGKKQ